MNNYYKDCAVPKPVDVKKKKTVNGYKNKPYRKCFFCSKRGAERHELFGGSLRQISIDNGFQIDVCRKHHEAMHRREGVWDDIVTDLRMKCQRQYEQKLIETGTSPEQARRVWMCLMGRNWL